MKLRQTNETAPAGNPRNRLEANFFAGHYDCSVAVTAWSADASLGVVIPFLQRDTT